MEPVADVARPRDRGVRVSIAREESEIGREGRPAESVERPDPLAILSERGGRPEGLRRVRVELERVSDHTAMPEERSTTPARERATARSPGSNGPRIGPRPSTRTRLPRGAASTSRGLHPWAEEVPIEGRLRGSLGKIGEAGTGQTNRVPSILEFRHGASNAAGRPAVRDGGSDRAEPHRPRPGHSFRVPRSTPGAAAANRAKNVSGPPTTLASPRGGIRRPAPAPPRRRRPSSRV